MIIKVYQFWNGQDATIREVEIPDEDFEECKQRICQAALGQVPPFDGTQALLDYVFHYGQNDVQQRKAPSVSVGDIIEFRTAPNSMPDFWVVAPVGFVNYGEEKHWMWRPTAPKPKTETKKENEL